MIVTSLMQGCGNGVDETEIAVSGSVDTKDVTNQDADRSTIKEGKTGPQETAPVNSVEVRPAAGEIKEDTYAKEDDVESQASGTIDAVSETVTSSQDIIDVITIENQGYLSDKKGPVMFSHLKHNKDYGVSCVVCHHLYKDGENKWKEGDRIDKCIACHDPVEDKDKIVKLQTAFHKKCRDCHSEANKEGKEAPSTKCNGCHG